jgi:hypothetical protein
VPWTLVLLSALECAIGLGYLAVGAHYGRRAAAGHDRWPALFALFWCAFGAYGLLEALWSLAVAALPLPFEVGVTILHVKVVLACLGFFGLVCYLARLYTGRDVRLPAGAYYATALVVLLYSYDRAEPVGQEVQAWRGGLVYARSDGVLGTWAPILAMAPALGAAIAFLGLARVAPDAAARRRVVRLGTALVVFLAGLSLGWLNATWFWWPLAEKLLALVAIAGAVDALRGAPATDREVQAVREGTLPR